MRKQGVEDVVGVRVVHVEKMGAPLGKDSEAR